MAQSMIQLPPDSTGKQIETALLGGLHRQVTVLGDPLTATNIATVAQFHQADNQSPGGTAYGLLTGGVAQLLNVSGNLDRQRETGIDGASPQGIVTGAAQFGMQFLTTDSTDNFIAGTRTFTPAAMSGTVQGVSWSIQVGSVLSLDSGTSQENVLVTAVTATTFTCVTTKTHNGTVTPFLVQGFVFNQERDCSGELDGGSGSGAAMAVEYHFNGGGGGTVASPNNTQNYDRARNVFGKGGVGTTTISSGGGAASTSVVLAGAPTGLQPGMPLFFMTGTTIANGISEIQYVRKDYTPGSTTVPLQQAIATAHANGNMVAWDTYSPGGPGLGGFLPTGISVEEEVLWDPVSGLFYFERSATQDGQSGQNVVMENPALFNGSTMDRGYNNWRQTALNAQVVSGAGTINTPDLTNWNARGIAILLDLTAWTSGGTSTTINVQVKAGADYLTVNSFAFGVLGSTGLFATILYPAAVAAGTWTVSPQIGVLARTFRLQIVTVGAGTSYTASLYVDELL